MRGKIEQEGGEVTSKADSVVPFECELEPLPNCKSRFLDCKGGGSRTYLKTRTTRNQV